MRLKLLLNIFLAKWYLPALLVLGVAAPLINLVMPSAEENSGNLDLGRSLESSISKSKNNEQILSLEGGLVCRRRDVGAKSEPGFFDDKTGSFISLRDSLLEKIGNSRAHVREARAQLLASKLECRRAFAASDTGKYTIASNPNNRVFSIFSDSIDPSKPPNTFKQEVTCYSESDLGGVSHHIGFRDIPRRTRALAFVLVNSDNDILWAGVLGSRFKSWRNGLPEAFLPGPKARGYLGLRNIEGSTGYAPPCPNYGSTEEFTLYGYPLRVGSVGFPRRYEFDLLNRRLIALSVARRAVWKASYQGLDEGDEDDDEEDEGDEGDEDDDDAPSTPTPTLTPNPTDTPDVITPTITPTATPTFTPTDTPT
jgi:phosphatidylethanolamine-binding protein (PEBP) family uncharacterized protein